MLLCGAMEKSSLSILVDEKRVNDLLKSKTGAKAFLRSGCNLFVFISFIVLFTVMALSERFGAHRAFEAYVRRKFDSGAQMPLQDVATIADFWQYTNVSLMPGIYGQDVRKYSYPGAVVQRMLQIDGKSNRLFGVGRIRMNKVLPNKGCSTNDVFEPHFDTCYGPFDPGVDDRQSYGPASSTGSKEFKRTCDPKVKSNYHGKLAEYPPCGFMQALTANYTQADEKVRLLQREDWLTAAARVIFVEFTLYNFNLGIYAVCQIVFEISPTGGWVKTFDVDILEQRHLKPLGLGSASDWIMLVCEAALVIFVFRYIAEEISEFVGCEIQGGRCRNVRLKTEYFTDGWNLLDWLNLALIVAVMGYRIQTWSAGQEVLDDSISNLESDVKASLATFVNLNPVAQNVRTLRHLVAFNAVLTWLKAVKYINIIPYIATFMETLRISYQLLLSFLAVFLSCFIGFCLAYSVAFGENLTNLRTPWRALIYLARSFLGNADMGVIYDRAPILGSFLILIFIIGMILICMNLFYAIMVSALSDAKQTQDMKQSKKWAQTLDKIQGFWETVSEVLSLQERFRQFVPGLYSRLNTRAKKREARERERDKNARLKMKGKTSFHLSEDTLGPASPSCGRRPKRAVVSSTVDEDAQSDAGTEPDLGPLRSRDDLIAKNNMLADFGEMEASPQGFGGGGAPMLQSGRLGGGFGLGPPQQETEELTDDAVDLVYEAAVHVIHGVKQRCRGARDLVLGEMDESRVVLNGLCTVLEVLGKRARDLEAQQIQLLRHF